MNRSRSATACLLATTMLLSGCALGLNELPAVPREEPAGRRHPARLLDTPDEARVLAACTSLLQDMGFQVDEASAPLGVLSGSKTRDANRLTPAQRVAVGATTLVLLAGGYTLPLGLLLLGAESPKPVKVEASITTRKVGPEGGQVSVSVIFWENSNYVTEPKVYQEFFGLLSKALFLEVGES